ncbi:MAG: HD-GYP domain-containing protein, partial [bacterium]
ASAVVSRSRLESLGRFVQDQLLEKAVARYTLEDTTEYLLEKYEELMFLYAITENISPDSAHQKTLSVILDKGIQKLNASWGLFSLGDQDSDGQLELVQAAGSLPWGKQSEFPSGLRDLMTSCSGPAVAAFDPQEDPAGQVPGSLMILPFRVKNFSAGALVFGWPSRSAVGEADLRFAQALSRQASSILYAVQLYRELAELLFATLGALSSAIDAKDPYTHGHSQRVAEYAVVAARHLGYSSKFLTMLKIAGQLHDFGKIGVREHILGKVGLLDDKERQAMREHPVIGAQILGRFKPFAGIVPGIRHHHERFDGGGYPDGLKSGQIPIVGRIIAVADAYDAMTTSRPYRGCFGHDDALVELRNHSGTQFDPDVVEAFIDAVGRRGSG